jgi:hypothetical protein
LNLAVSYVRDPVDPKRPFDDASHHAHSAAVLDGSSPLPDALLAMAMADRAPLLARYHASRAYRVNDKSPVAALAMARIHADDSSAREWIERAGAADGAALASALLHAKVRRWADALKDLDRVTEKSYEAAVLRGVATHGMRAYAKAEALYGEAIALDAKRPEAHFNLGELWRASAIRTTERATAKALLQKAADSYRRAGTAAAKAHAADCDKALAAL